jgi:hypothetical protein
MNILRKICLSLLSSLLVFLLFATAFDVGFVRTATHPATVKKLVADSGIYNTVVSSSLDQLKSINTSVGTIDSNNPLVQKAANQAVNPQYVQRQAESAIDNVYQWLDGNIAQPNFNIDLNAQKGQFAKNAADSLQQQLAGLPVCTTTAQIQSFGVLNATCLPPGVSAQDVAAQVQADLNNSDFLSQANIKAADLKSNESCQGNICPDIARQKSVFNPQIPEKYQLIKKTPFILSALTILCGIGIILLSKTWQVGLRHVGINLVVIGALMLALSFFLPRVVSKDVAPKLRIDSAGIQLDLSKVVNDVVRQIDKNYWFFGGLYTVVGAGAIIGSEIHRRKHAPVPAATPPENSRESTEESVTTQPKR